MGLMKTFRVADDLPLENDMVSKALDTAQENVEAYFRDIRGQLMAYDEVLAKQRSAVYRERRNILMAGGEEVMHRLREDCYATAREIVPNYDGNSEGMQKKLEQFFKGINISVAELETAESVVGYVESRADRLSEGSTDNVMVEATRYLRLTQIDNLWTAHMKTMDYLKEFIVLRSYGSDDPLQQYQLQGFEIFEEMLKNVRRNTVYSVFQYDRKPEQAGV